MIANMKKIMALLLAVIMLLGMLPTAFAAGSEYLDQSGNPVEGLMEAIEGKRHWLENTDPMPVVKTEGEGEVTLSNGAISRTFAIPEKGGTGFYTKSYANTYIGKELVNGSNTPEVILSLYNKPYEEVYNRKKIIDNTPGYYFIGGENAAENTFAFDSYEIRSITADDVQFQWKKNAHSYSDPAAEDWPPKGMHAEFNFVAPSSFPADYQGLQVKVIYEMYDNCAVMKKRVEIVNTKDTMVMIGGLAPEVLSANGNDNMKELMLIQSDFTTETTSSNHPKEKCLCQKEPDGSPFKALGGDRRHICYDLGPAYEISTDPGKAAADRFISFNTYELIYSTYWLEQRALEEEGYYRKMFPWITDNPLTYHCTDYLTKEEIDMAVEGGFDMIIHSYNADGSSDEKQMLARDQKTLDKYKELVDYAHSRGIEVGMYQGHHKLNQYGSKYKPDGKPKDLTYGGNDGGKYGVFCMASAAFDDYWDNFRYFVEYTGLDCIEIDGAYGSWDCLNGEDHINEDKETDPDPNGVDKTTGDASKYRVHHGYFDSKVVQWENITRELCETFREMDTYIRVPSWWYAIGGNKNTIGYEEIAWSQPRQEQLIYGRQMIYNAGYARTMSMCWSHIPFSQYHGGGDSAAFLPFSEKIDDYNWVVAQNVGNGVTSDFRGKDLYDETVLPILTRWVNFFDRYRGIVNSDMVHISQARSNDNPLRTGKMDTLYHVNANNEGEKGLLWVYNQTDEERTEIITVPMYYTGLTELSYPSYPLPGSMGKNVKSYSGGSGKYGWLPKVRDYTLPDVTGETTGRAAFLQEGSKLQVLDIDSNGNAQLSVTLAPMSFTYYTIYDPTEAPAVEMDIGAVTGLTGESQSSGVALTWNADASVSVKVNGVVDTDSTEIITGYRIYRDGELIGTSLTNAFTDTSVLEELTAYTYTVKALVGVQEGAASDEAQVTTGADTTPPELLSVSSSGNKLVLTFSEVMAKAAAETLANYTLDQNVKVTGAALSADGKTVTLTVEGMESQKQYTLTVKNLTDNAKTPNPMADTEWTFINGYLAYYPMDGEELINSFSDSVANTQNVTYTASTGRDGCVYLNKKDKAYADLGYGWFSGSTDYSLALSVWPKDLSSARQAVLSSGQNGEPGDDFGIYLLAGKVVFTTSDASGEKVVELSSKKVLDADAWSRIMVTRSGDEFALYVNGELQEKVEKAGFPTYESKNAILLGAEVAYGGGDQTSYLWGRVDELVAYSNALSADAVTKDYDSYSPYTAVRPLIYMDFETAGTGKVINLADGKEFTVLGNPQTETSFNDSTALKLENDAKTSSTYINMGQDYALGGEFTLSAWINVNCDNVKQMNKLICRGLVGNDAEAYFVSIRNQGYNIRMANKDKSALSKLETENDTSKGYFPSKEWAHLTVICDGTTIRAYCNGKPAALTSKVTGALNLRSNTRDLLIGGAKKNKDGVSLQVDHFFNGSMDEFYLFDAALSEADIQDLMGSNTPVDKSKLQSLYDQYAEAEQGSYTDASWKALQDALAKAEEVLQDKDADQVTVNEAYNLLQEAVNGLQQEVEEALNWIAWDDEKDNSRGWVRGEVWPVTVEDGVEVYTSAESDAQVANNKSATKMWRVMVLEGSEATEGSMEVEFKIPNGVEAGLMFNAPTDISTIDAVRQSTRVYFKQTQWFTNRSGIKDFQMKGHLSATVADGNWHKLKVIYKAGWVGFYLDDVLIQTIENENILTGANVGLYSNPKDQGDGVAKFRNFKVLKPAQATEHTVTYTLTNLTAEGTKTVKEGESLTATLTAESGYTLPDTITVTMGGQALTEGYTYDKSNGTVTVANVTGDVVITAAGAKILSSAAEILEFVIAGGSTQINGTAISVTMPYGTDVTNLTPTITVSENAAVVPGSGVPQNFTAPVSYTVTAEDGTTKTYTVTVVVAEPDTYAITAAQTSNGTVATEPTSAAADTKVQITVTPKDGYQLKEGTLKAYKTGEPDTEVAIENNAFTMPAYAVTVTAEFEAIKYTVTYKLNGGSNAAGNPTWYTVEEGFTLADPTKTGYNFTGWTYDGVASPVKNVTIEAGTTGNLTFTANWEENASSGGDPDPVTSYTITVTQGVGGKISPSTSSVVEGSDKNFTITANEGYRISDVLVDGRSVGAVSTYTFKNVTAKHSITAKFEKVEGITNVGGFIDVKSTDWFAKAVQYAVDEGLMNGTSSNTFTPNGDTTRGMIVTILYRQAGSPRVKSDKATWWSDARVWAMECGVSDGTNMEKPITREQLATMLYRYAELNGKDVSKRTSLDSFKDGDKVSTYAVDALKWAVAEGIVTGKTGGFIDPQAGATRAETATMLMRFCEAFA